MCWLIDWLTDWLARFQIPWVGFRIPKENVFWIPDFTSKSCPDSGNNLTQGDQLLVDYLYTTAMASMQGSIQGIRGVEAFPPKKCPASPQKNLLSLRYIVGNYIGKIIQTRQGHCTHCNISQSCVSKCTRLHLSAYSFHIISGAACPGTPLGSSMPSATQDFSPKK